MTNHDLYVDWAVSHYRRTGDTPTALECAGRAIELARDGQSELLHLSRLMIALMGLREALSTTQQRAIASPEGDAS